MLTVKLGHKIISRFRSALTVVLVLWCAGAGCMIVSYAHVAAMTAANTDSGSSAWSETSGSMGTHDCCKARHASERQLASSTKHVWSSGSLASSEELAEFPAPANAISCCPLTSGTFVVNSRQRISNDDASAPPSVEAVPGITRFAATPRTRPLRLLNQNQTYLRGCVFLI
jgi:hypothetical protein